MTLSKKELGNLIKSARSIKSKKIGRKYTQDMLAKDIQISRSYLGDFESGRKYPNFEILNKIADACGVHLGFFSSTSLDKGVDFPYVKDSLSKIDMSKKIPVVGIIRAGEPILAQQNIINYVDLPQDITKGKDNLFGLVVIGDSMNSARIMEGDTIIVEMQNEVENGEIAVVLVDSECATVKHFYRTDNIVTLVPDSTNPIHKPRVIDTMRTNVKVLGKVIGALIKF